MRERGSDEEDDSDLSEESKAAVKPRKAKANMAAANREDISTQDKLDHKTESILNRDMPPDSSSEEEDEQPRAAAPDEEEKKAESEEEDSDDDDAELERLYGMGKNTNASVKVVPQAKQGKEAVAADVDDISASDDDE